MSKLPKNRQLTGRRARKIKVRKGMINLYHGTDKPAHRNIMKLGFRPTNTFGLRSTFANNRAYASNFGQVVRNSQQNNHFYKHGYKYPKTKVVHLAMPRHKADKLIVRSVGERLVKKDTFGMLIQDYVHTKAYATTKRIPRKYLR
jgi:hypothetical protein